MDPVRTIRIATRKSPLALWQADAVKNKLKQSGYECELVIVESLGDKEQTVPIYAMGIAGVFTKELDTAVLDHRADLAVHSLKDVPTLLAEDLVLAAVLERGPSEDVIVYKRKEILIGSANPATVATSSLRRRAQWLAKFPAHKTVPLRGNIETRLKKLDEDQSIDGVIFAKAGLARLNLIPENSETLDWMLPAPAQGIIGIVCRGEDDELKMICKGINHHASFVAAYAERQFMQSLQGGCSAPVSAHAVLVGSELDFRGAIHAPDGSRQFEVHLVMLSTEWKEAGHEASQKLLEQAGAGVLLEEIRNKKFD